MAEKTMEQMMMGMMIAVMGIAIISQVLQAQAAPVVPSGNATVTLKNPPSDGTMWSLSLVDWDITAIINFVGHNGKDRLDIDEIAGFEIPSGWVFPLRIGALSITKWKDGIVGGTIQQVYYVQSMRPYLWDFDEMEWSDEPDPTYREAFLTAFGASYFDVDLEAFTIG